MGNRNTFMYISFLNTECFFTWSQKFIIKCTYVIATHKGHTKNSTPLGGRRNTAMLLSSSIQLLNSPHYCYKLIGVKDVSIVVTLKVSDGSVTSKRVRFPHQVELQLG